MASAIQIGSVIDQKYRVVRHIGEGGMGSVYEGENTRIERRVAIKVLHEHVASSPEFAQRFEREARASARIGSPHVCDVLDLGDLPNGDRYIVMEYLEGESLEDRIVKAGRIPAEHLAPIAFEILEGLGTMHHAGVIHRDLKPANVFLVRRPSGRETVKILDFGVAKILPKADDPAQMTATGMMMGTPLYMSPEQARGARDVDGRTDLYAASVIFYRALTGAMPHSGLNLHELLFKIVLEDPKPITDLAPEVDPAFAAIITKGLSRDADTRYASAREFQEAIAAWGHSMAKPPISFSVTLPNEPPKLRNVSGSFTADQLKQLTPVSGPGIMKGNTPVVTPIGNNGEAQSKATVVSGQQRTPHQGTPTAWADDAPAIAKRALAELEAKGGTHISNLRGTKVMSTSSPPIAPPQQITASSPRFVSSPPSKKPLSIGIAVGAVALIAAAFLGVRTIKGGGADPAPTTTTAAAHTPPSAAPSADPPPVDSSGTGTAPPGTAASSATPEPSTTTAANPIPGVHPNPHLQPRPNATPSASTKASASAPVPPPVTPSASASSGQRKFRQTIE